MSIDQRINELAVAIVETIEARPEDYGVEDNQRIPDEVLAVQVLMTAAAMLEHLHQNGNIESGDFLNHMLRQIEDMIQI